MSFVQKFAPHLAFLRRYARALTGSQASGDAYVRASLAALSSAPDALDVSLPDRIALYRFCHVIWDSTGAKLERDAAERAPDEKLQALPPRQRQAFLLTEMEGFTHQEAAHILGTNTQNVTALVNTALKEIDAILATNVLIIEDEPIIAADLEDLVEDLGHSVTGNATTHKEAVEMARQSPPGLVLCDIQLADDSSGLEAAEAILSDFDVPVIFITAYPERLLTGERKEPTYLITKPFQSSAVKAAVGQALFFHAGNKSSNL